LQDLNIYPNPSNYENIIIKFNLKKDSEVQINALYPLGRIKNVYFGKLNAGNNTITDDSKREYAWIYFYSLILENEIHTMKIVSNAAEK